MTTDYKKELKEFTSVMLTLVFLASSMCLLVKLKERYSKNTIDKNDLLMKQTQRYSDIQKAKSINYMDSIKQR